MNMKERNIEIYNLVKQGKTFTELSEIYNISKSCIAQVYNKQCRVIRDIETSELYKYLYENIEDNPDGKQVGYVNRIYWALRRRNINTLEQLNELLQEDDDVIINKIRYLGARGIQILRSIKNKE